MDERSWEVLLIGGASGVGKTELARQLSARLGVGITDGDDLQTALHAITTPEMFPLLHLWRTDWDRFAAMSDAERVDYFVSLSREIFTPAYAAIVADHLEFDSPTIFVASFVLPELIVASSFGDEPNGGRVRGVILTEPDESQIAANYGHREDDPQDFRAHASWMNQQWLVSQAQQVGVPVIPARPWASGVDRVLAALSPV